MVPVLPLPALLVPLLLGLSQAVLFGARLGENITAAKQAARGEPCQQTIRVVGSDQRMPAVGYTITRKYERMERDTQVPGITNFLKAGGRLIAAERPGYSLGYRYVDEAIRNTQLRRADVWVTSKFEPISMPMFGIRTWMATQIDKNLETLGLTYVDVMYLNLGNYVTSESIKRSEHITAWRGMIDAKEAGKVRNLGVHQHTRKEIEALVNATGVWPAVALVWLSPFMPKEQLEYVQWLQKSNIAVMAYGFLSWSSYDDLYAQDTMSTAKRVLDRHQGATMPQLVIRWLLDKNVAVVTDMSNPAHLDEDLHCLPGSVDTTDADVLSTAKRDCGFYEKKQPLMGCHP
mmetsp:Transcript_20557/g.59534  ORF Transcript_20557/g.59534 Transcript_20557/m.59534 type:complete len:346 (+) Transcript_20557:99-1136(+)